MAEERKVIRGQQFLQALLDAGVVKVEEKVRRVVIDAQADGLVSVFVERYGDDRLLDVVVKAALEVSSAATDRMGGE